MCMHASIRVGVNDRVIIIIIMCVCPAVCLCICVCVCICVCMCGGGGSVSLYMFGCVATHANSAGSGLQNNTDVIACATLPNSLVEVRHFYNDYHSPLRGPLVSALLGSFGRAKG